MEVKREFRLLLLPVTIASFSICGFSFLYVWCIFFKKGIVIAGTLAKKLDG